MSGGCKLNSKEVKAGLHVGKEVRHTGVRFQGCVLAKSRDVIAILQHDLCEEIGQAARLPFSPMRPTGSSPVLCLQAATRDQCETTHTIRTQNHSPAKSDDELSIRCSSDRNTLTVFGEKKQHNEFLMFASFSLRLGGANWSCEGHRGWNGWMQRLRLIKDCSGSPVSSPELMKRNERQHTSFICGLDKTVSAVTAAITCKVFLNLS